MPKYCFSCMKKIPLLAGRCPHCLDEDQYVYGRLILVILLIVGIIALGTYSLSKNEPTSDEEFIELLESMGVDQ